MGAPWIETRPLRSRRTPSASGRAPSVRGPVPHTGPRPAPCPKGTLQNDNLLFFSSAV
jgi:hypothetical protein